jgi:hypothetical protein
MQRVVTATVIILSIAGCDGECLHPPCPLPIAMEVVVTSASSGMGVSGTSLDVRGPISSTVPCDSSCTVGGYAGTYTLNVTAPGYQPAARTVVVQGTSPSCGCASAQTQHVSFALTPTP